MDSMFFFVDVLVLAFGAYVLYGWWKLRKAGGLIDSKLIYPNGCSADNCRDPEGFYVYILPRFLLLGIFTFLDGLVTVLNDQLSFLPGLASILLSALFLAFIVYYGVIISKSYHRFFQ
ncbi:MAG: hypothetical protein VB055_05715 [Oscillospiraceae bacterium]|nr:hypothetical protein [Oscillospiraceae bacterium]